MKVKLVMFILIVFQIKILVQKITISGYVKDAATKESLIGATVVNVASQSGTSTNQYGFFSLSAPVADTIELIISYAGYTIQAKRITLKINLRLTVLLESLKDSLNEVVVIAGKNDRNVQKAQMGVIDVPLGAIKNLRVIFGERDVLKVI